MYLVLCKSEREGTGDGAGLARPNQNARAVSFTACRHKAALCDVPTGAASTPGKGLAGVVLQVAAAGFLCERSGIVQAF